MLILKAEVYFDNPNDNQEGLPNDLSTKNIIRPSLNFGNDVLFSGTILADENIESIIRGQYYTVTIEMPSIGNEELECIRGYLRVGSPFKIQSASKKIGKGKILDYLYG
ncbi:hypothetical protein [Brevibacillus sp. NRS-1366]|uniref:hypothetical protein n=1 Tax=Brevibacillus sp. NRS-1366 TaxID=3233899 RepID=UPI003D1E3965